MFVLINLTPLAIDIVDSNTRNFTLINRKNKTKPKIYEIASLIYLEKYCFEVIYTTFYK